MSEQTPRLKVLDVGAGPNSNAKAMWPEAEVLTLDIDKSLKPDIVGSILDIRCGKEQFDRVVASHVLEHLALGEVAPALREVWRVLKVGGEAHIFVPSIEWAARQVLAEHPSPILFFHLYGSQQTPWQFHKCGFTMLALRTRMADAGLVPMAAQRAIYYVDNTTGDGQTTRYEAEQHYVVGVKHHADHAGSY